MAPPILHLKPYALLLFEALNQALIWDLFQGLFKALFHTLHTLRAPVGAKNNK